MSATPVPSNLLSNAPAQENSSSTTDNLILEYLKERAFKDAVQSQLTSRSLDNSRFTVSDEELKKHLIPFWPKKEGTTEDNALVDARLTLQSLLSAEVTSPNVANLLSNVGPGSADEILTFDPLDRCEGFRDLESWAEGSLEMYKSELRPILYPIFVHFYLDLVQFGFRDAGLSFHSTFSPSLMSVHQKSLHHFCGLLLPSHVQQDELAQRFRNEKYVLRMSRSGFSLLIGWLTEGFGGEGAGSGEGFSGERGKRGRTAVMRVTLNDDTLFLVAPLSSTTISPHAWEESTGLLASLVPELNKAVNKVSEGVGPAAYNDLKKDLKLGPAPIDENLRLEAERVLTEQALLSIDRDTALLDFHQPVSAAATGLVSPLISDFLPRPPTYKIVDIKREVEKLRDARKRIRLEPSILSSEGDVNDMEVSSSRVGSLPSICTYTIHDVPDGIPSVAFSSDSSILAVGFLESYIRLWSLKRENLAGLRNDFQISSIRNLSSLQKLRDKNSSATRKLIGHSGPVYSMSFDPFGGSASIPKYLLSASADRTVRLWSLDTMSSIIAYRGHQSPIWDVQWSPLGTYFATGSRDKTARLWSTEKISALRIYAGHLGDVDCLSFHPNSIYLATGSNDWTCRLWDVQHGNTIRLFIGHQGDITALAISPDGRYLASAGEDLTINLWDLGSGRRIKKMLGHTGPIYSLAFSNESSLLVSGGADWTVRCWDVKSAGAILYRSNRNDNGAFSGQNGNMDQSYKEHNNEENRETNDLLETYPTRRTPIVNVQFTPRNLCLTAGPFMPLELL